MTKAQQVRSRRLAKRSEGITAEAEKIFSWILDLMDEDTEKGYYGSLEIFLFGRDISSSIIIAKETPYGPQYEYDATNAIFKYGRYALFEELETIVNREDGFVGKLTPYAKYDGVRCIMFNVVIK